MTIQNHSIETQGPLEGRFAGLTRDAAGCPVVLVETPAGTKAWHATTPSARTALFSERPTRGQNVHIYSKGNGHTDLLKSLPNELHAVDPAEMVAAGSVDPDAAEFLALESEAWHADHPEAPGQRSGVTPTPAAVALARQFSSSGPALAARRADLSGAPAKSRIDLAREAEAEKDRRYSERMAAWRARNAQIEGALGTPTNDAAYVEGMAAGIEMSRTVELSRNQGELGPAGQVVAPRAIDAPWR